LDRWSGCGSTDNDLGAQNAPGLRSARWSIGSSTRTLTGVVIAGVLASFVVPGPYSWGSTLIGVILLAILVGYAEPPALGREIVGFAAAVAFALLLTLGVAFDTVWNISGWRDGDTADKVQQFRSDGWEAGVAWLALFGLVIAITVPVAYVRDRRARRAEESPSPTAAEYLSSIRPGGT
jgi:hypothetical protein